LFGQVTPVDIELLQILGGKESPSGQDSVKGRDGVPLTQNQAIAPGVGGFGRIDL
jgi:hypothetical protein